MPNDADHINLAVKNQRAINHLLPARKDHPEWVATIAFYKAVHVVEAMFFQDPTIRHTSDHPTRNRHLKTQRRYSHIWHHYRRLFAASLVARYLQDEQHAGYSTFSDYLSSDDVVSSLLNDHLHQVEKSALGRLPQKLRDALRAQPAQVIIPAVP